LAAKAVKGGKCERGRGGHLEDGAFGIRAAGVSGAVKIAVAALDEAGVRILAVRATGAALAAEVVQRRMGASRRDHVDRAAPIAAAAVSCAVEVAVAAKGQAADRVGAVSARAATSAAETVKRGQSAGGSDSENRPIHICSAFFRGAVEVTVWTLDKNPRDDTVGAISSAQAAEAVEGGVRARRGDLENGAGATSDRVDGTSRQSGAIEVAVVRLHQAGTGGRAVRAVGTALAAEGIENRIGVGYGTGGGGSDREHRERGQHEECEKLLRLPLQDKSYANTSGEKRQESPLKPPFAHRRPPSWC